jgi:hypothetical protein
LIYLKEYWALWFKYRIIPEIQSICLFNFCEKWPKLKKIVTFYRKIYPLWFFLYNVLSNLFNPLVRVVFNSYAANFRNKDPKSPKNHEILQNLKLRKHLILNCKDKYFLYWLSICNLLIWIQNYRLLYWTTYFFYSVCVFYAIKCRNITKNCFFNFMKWTKMEKIDFWLPW